MLTTEAKLFLEYLNKQMDMHSYIDGKINDSETHKHMYDAYNHSKDKFKELFCKGDGE